MGEADEQQDGDFLSPDPTEVGESPTTPTYSSDDTEPITDDQPSYTQYTYDADDLKGIPVPTPLKMIVGADKDAKKNKNKSKQEIANMAKTNQAMLKMLYKSADTVASKYRVAITDDEDMIITHSEADYNWISGMSNAYLMEKGFDINSYIGTGKAAIICNGWWFGSIGATLHNDAKKLDKKLGLIRKPLSWGRKLLSYIPIVGKRFKKKPDIYEPAQNVEGLI